MVVMSTWGVEVRDVVTEMAVMTHTSSNTTEKDIIFLSQTVKFRSYPAAVNADLSLNYSSMD